MDEESTHPSNIDTIMKQVIVGFSRPKTWKPFAEAIMAAYRTDYDHVYLKFHSDTYQRDIIYQASSVMVNFMGTDVFDANNEVVKEFTIQMSDESYVKMMQFCIDAAGTPYSIKLVLGFAWVVVNKWFGKIIPNPVQGSGLYVCSVIVAYIMENYQGDKAIGNVDSADPTVVYNFLSSGESSSQ